MKDTSSLSNNKVYDPSLMDQIAADKQVYKNKYLSVEKERNREIQQMNKKLNLEIQFISKTKIEEQIVQFKNVKIADKEVNESRNQTKLYRGFDIQLGKAVIIKQLDRKVNKSDPQSQGAVEKIDMNLYSKDEQYREQTLGREITVYQIVNSATPITGLIDVFDVFADPLKIQRILIAMEYCNQGDMNNLLTIQNEKEKISKIFTLSPLETAFILEQLLRGYSFLLKNHIFHRDIQTDNVLINNGKFQIADFDVSRLDEQNPEISDTVVGTDKYMCPQKILNNRHYDKEQSDVWSFGVMILIMIAGDFEFQPQFGGAVQTLNLLCQIINEQIEQALENNKNGDRDKTLLQTIFYGILIKKKEEEEDDLQDPQYIKENQRIGISVLLEIVQSYIQEYLQFNNFQSYFKNFRAVSPFVQHSRISLEIEKKFQFEEQKLNLIEDQSQVTIQKELEEATKLFNKKKQNLDSYNATKTKLNEQNQEAEFLLPEIRKIVLLDIAKDVEIEVYQVLRNYILLKRNQIAFLCETLTRIEELLTFDIVSQSIGPEDSKQLLEIQEIYKAISLQAYSALLLDLEKQLLTKPEIIQKIFQHFYRIKLNSLHLQLYPENHQFFFGFHIYKLIKDNKFLTNYINSSEFLMLQKLLILQEKIVKGEIKPNENYSKNSLDENKKILLEKIQKLSMYNSEEKTRIIPDTDDEDGSINEKLVELISRFIQEAEILTALSQQKNQQTIEENPMVYFNFEKILSCPQIYIKNYDFDWEMNIYVKCYKWDFV